MSLTSRCLARPHLDHQSRPKPPGSMARSLPAGVRRSAVVLLATTLLTTLLAGTDAHAAGRKVSAWLPYWDHARGVASFTANADQYSNLSPFWYKLSSNGAIVGYPGAGDSSVVSAAQSAGVPLIPAISNEFDPKRVNTMMANTKKRYAHENALVNLVTSKGYAGIDLDYESLWATDRSRFTTFVRELANKLHAKGKTLSVTVHPKTSEPGTWTGPQAQDYAAIGSYADIVRPMAYDFHWSTSTPGAIAPAWWVDQVAQFTASVIPPSKVQLGLGLYGYDWVGTQGTGVTYAEVQALVTQNAAVRQWSSTDQAPWFTYSKDGIQHTVWYEDAQSVQAKLGSVTRYGLAGAVFWRLGGEDSAVWGATLSSL